MRFVLAIRWIVNRIVDLHPVLSHHLMWCVVALKLQQYQVITNDDGTVLEVRGCAGSDEALRKSFSLLFYDIE